MNSINSFDHNQLNMDSTSEQSHTDKKEIDEDTLSLNSERSNSQGFINEPLSQWPAWSVVQRE